MKPRVTVNMTEDGVFEMWLNEAGRDLLVLELQRLNERHEHFHLSPDDGSELQVSTKDYRPKDRVLEYGKIYYRTDGWDRRYFPHVMKAGILAEAVAESAIASRS